MERAFAKIRALALPGAKLQSNETRRDLPEPSWRKTSSPLQRTQPVPAQLPQTEKSERSDGRPGRARARNPRRATDLVRWSRECSRDPVRGKAGLSPPAQWSHGEPIPLPVANSTALPTCSADRCARSTNATCHMKRRKPHPPPVRFRSSDTAYRQASIREVLAEPCSSPAPHRGWLPTEPVAV